MRKILLSFTLLSLLTACVEAEKIKVADPEHRYTQYALGANAIDPEINSASFIILPNDNEIPAEYSFRLSDVDFAAVMASLEYGNRIPREIAQELPSEKKVQYMVEYILSVSHTRDRGAYGIKQYNKAVGKIKKGLTPLFESAPCYEIRGGPNRRKCLKQEDPSIKTRKSVAKNCNQFERRFDDFIDFTDAEATEYRQKIAMCGQVDSITISLFKKHACYEVMAGQFLGQCFPVANERTSQSPSFPESCAELKSNLVRFVALSAKAKQIYLADIKTCEMAPTFENSLSKMLEEKIKATAKVRNQGSEVVMALFKHLTKLTQESYLGVTSAKDSDYGDLSIIKFNESYTEVTELKFKQDWGMGAGFKEYSIENGAITNIRLYEERPGLLKLDFDMNVDNEVQLEVTSSHTSGLNEFGDRFIGEFKAYYPNGIVREGFFRLDTVPETKE